MQKEDIIYKTYLEILKEELLCAMGCTEPIAIAYGASIARDTLDGDVKAVKVFVSNNIIKNVKSVTVPNTGGLKGIKAAVASGIVVGKSEKILEVIADVKKEEIGAIERFIREVPIEVKPIDLGNIFDIIVEVLSDKSKATVRIAKYHTNVVYIKKDDDILLDKGEAFADCQEVKIESSDHDRSLLTIADIYEFAQSVDIEDVRELLDKEIQANEAIALEGLKNDHGANIGSTILSYYGGDVRARAIAKAAAASDARMSGCDLAVVINSGSGNQGITVSVPLIEYAKELKVQKDKLYRALVLSNLIAIHEKSDIGTLSAYCGAVSAGCAAGCGIAYLHGADLDTIAHTLVNSLAIASGIICDGAKASCAAKIAISVEAGIMGYHLYLNGQQFYGGEGIVAKGVEKTIRNVGLLGREGMRETDKEIVKIMLQE